MTATTAGLKKLELVSAQAQGFRGFTHPMKFEFTNALNLFLGDNGKGKSSIGELIVWVITGRNMAGNKKDLNVLNKDSDTVIGILTFKDEQGNVHELERKQSSSMTIKYDYETITQTRLEEIIPVDLFLCVFNPNYFLTLLPENARKTIANLFPATTKDEVLSEMDDYHREHLSKEPFEADQTNEYLKNRNEELRTLDEDRKWLEGYIGKLKEPIIVPEARVFDNSRLMMLQKQLDELLGQKPELKDIQELLKIRSGFQQRLTQIQHQTFPELPTKMELLQEKAVLEQKLKTVSERQFVPFNPSSIEAKLTVLRNDYKHMLEGYRELDRQSLELDKRHVHVKEGDQCPYCKQSISKQSVEVLANELATVVAGERKELSEKKAEKQKSLADLEMEGKALAAEISKAKTEDDQARLKFEQEKNGEISALQTRITQIEAELALLGKEEKAFEESKQSQIQSLQKEIADIGLEKIEAENVRIQREFSERISAEKVKLQTEIASLQKEHDEIVAHEANRILLQKKSEDQIRELAERNKEMESFVKREEEIRSKVYRMKNFNMKKIELLNRKIKMHLNHVEIRLQKTIESTGEIKDCFEIFYDNKELRICSLSETIRAGLEISRMVSTLSGVSLPVFVDNGESITTYDDPGFQTIEVRVVKDKPLTMVRGGKEIEIVAGTKPVTSSKPKTASSGRYSRSTSAGAANGTAV